VLDDTPGTIPPNQLQRYFADVGTILNIQLFKLVTQSCESANASVSQPDTTSETESSHGSTTFAEGDEAGVCHAVAFSYIERFESRTSGRQCYKSVVGDADTAAPVEISQPMAVSPEHRQCRVGHVI
jgi:hypothetical protein